MTMYFLRTRYYSQEEGRKEEAEKRSWARVDRFENYHYDLKKAKEHILKKHTDSRVMSHKENEVLARDLAGKLK